MKIRNGFVSNSSSSSFVCDLCGRSESGWDMCIDDAGMIRCINDHIICENEMTEGYEFENISREDKIKRLIEEFESYKDRDGGTYYQLKSGEFTEEELEGIWEDYIDEIRAELMYEMPEKYCPICQMHEFVNSDLAGYLQKKTGYTRAVAFAKVKEANKRRKKLYDNEYIMYALQEAGLDMVNVVNEIRENFSTYKSFKEYIQ